MSRSPSPIAAASTDILPPTHARDRPPPEVSQGGGLPRFTVTRGPSSTVLAHQLQNPVPQKVPSDGDFPDLPLSSRTMKPQLNGRPQEPGSTPSSHRVSGSIHNMKVHF